MNDSPRWCDTCKRYGDHHTDRCPERWFLKGIVGPWVEVTGEEWIRAERAAGFRPKGEDRGQPATGGFGSNAIQGRRITTTHQEEPSDYDWDPEFRDVVWPPK